MSEAVLGFDNGCCGSERRATIVSFSKRREDEDEDEGGDDEFQMFQVLDPYMQTYLAHSGEGVQCCCGLPLPIPFERASKRSWWDPRFDSEILEGQYRRSSFKQIRLRFRYSMAYMAVVSLIWSFYLIAFGAVDATQKDAFPLGIIYFLFFLFSLATLWFTRSLLYRQYMFPASLTVAISLCFLSLISVGKVPVLSPTTDFAICVEVLLIIYTVIPLPLYLCILVSCIYSVSFECLVAAEFPVVRLFCHLSVHLVALHIFIMTNVRMRGTFMKVGQSLLVRRQLEMEKQLKEKMIHSRMPPKVADWLMEEGGAHFLGGDMHSLFRPFNMSCMKDVSILFADIVGFTRMSSKKTASELVSVLNELFERFDHLCTKNGCEKISTLGDCYYCVSGCPTPRADHAQCCVEMGLGMIKAIAKFDCEKNEDVNMRVGVHTGTVLCGIVGRRRFKFDVWSNDVSLANKMESTGQPGRVHISEVTKRFLGDLYELELGEDEAGLRTYFIQERKVWDDIPSEGDSTCKSTLRSTKSCSVVNSIAFVDPLSTSGALTTPSPTQNFLMLPTKSRPHSKTLSLPSVFKTDNKIYCETHPNPIPHWKYSKLKLTDSSVENGKIKKIYNSSLNDSPPEKAVNTQLEVPKDDLSFCQSVNSRKDSGIRSNSRRSSIQQQLFVINGITGMNQGELMNNRVSGYYTSSQSSLNDEEKCGESKLAQPISDSLGACFQKIRKQSDLQLIRCVQDNSKSERSYFVGFPLKRWSLIFKHPEMEKEYRQNAHKTSPSGQNKNRTLATARFNTCFDVTVSIMVFASVFLSTLIYFPLSPLWLSTSLFLFSVQLCIWTLCVHSILKPIPSTKLQPLLEWYPWNSVGSVLVSLPLIIVLINFDQSTISRTHLHNYTYLLFIGLIHYCNFTQLNCWMKSFLAAVGAGIYLVLVTATVSANPELIKTETDAMLSPFTFLLEIYLNAFLLVLLVLFLNREFEISYRLSFHGNVVAARDKAKVELMKLQADWLLDNIIPKHVAEHLKTSNRYSEDVKNAGIIFAKITNFDEMYDETYLDGKECLRVLNELVSDFDELLSQPRFNMVEKIKTIGSTFMAASGLDLSQRKENSNEHLYQLMEFALALQAAIENFNTHLLSFKFILRVGYNYGDVTAGVIGTTKLYYDIWGDAVNIASRMDSTGVPNRIQVPASCLPILESRYEFEHRGTVFVKGKDNMEVYLVKGRKETLPSM